MSYGCSWTGEFRFVEELTGPQLAELNKFLGADFREHPEWAQWIPDGHESHGLTHIDLELTEDFGGLKWDGSEKTHDLDVALNLIIFYMEEFTEQKFALEGQILGSASGFDENYRIYIDHNGWAIEEHLPVQGKVTECPQCGKHFVDGEE